MKAKDLIEKHNGCQEAIEWAGDRTVQEAWDECPRGDWMLWMYVRLYPDNLRELTLAKAHCVNTVRHLMTDERSVRAVDVAIAFGNGELSRDALDRAADAADAAWAAAWAAAHAAAWAAAHAAVDAHADWAAAWVAVDAHADADAAWADNQKQTADICRKYLKVV